MQDSPGFSAISTREYLQKRGMKVENFVRYAYRPFDTRWLYWEREAKLLDRERSEYFAQIFSNNSFLFTTGRTRKNLIEPPIICSIPVDLNCYDSGARGFPLRLKPMDNLFGVDAENSDRTIWNLSDKAREYLESIKAEPVTLFLHVLAVMHSPVYRSENSGALRQDWPRIPMPASREILESSAAVGKQIAMLLDTETSVPGVTVVPFREDLKSVAILTHNNHLGLQDGDLAVTAGWGNGTKSGVMPGRGKVEEKSDGTLDVYLNEKVAWRGIPANAWRYTIGGYQVMKKWLSYREKSVLGRDLSIEEAREVQYMARRITAIIALEAELNLNYEVVCSAIYEWQD